MSDDTTTSEFTEEELVDALQTKSGLDAFVEKKFKGEKFPCHFCGVEISWPGMCEPCEKKQITPESTIEQRIEHLGVPHSMASCRWENFDMPTSNVAARLIEDLQKWKGIPPLVVLSGHPGTGKTHMAVATLRRRIESKGAGGVLWIADAEIGARLKAGFRNDEEPIEDELRNARLLIVDDFGQGYQSEWIVSTICPIICGRADRGQPTILSTNYTHQDIAGLDERLASRIQTNLKISTPSMGLKDRRRKENT